MKTIFSILAATALIAPGAIAQEAIDEDFGQTVRPGVHPIARILLFPIIPFVELQSELSPEKASCWNEGASEVIGCNVVEAFEEAQAGRPTPYAE